MNIIKNNMILVLVILVLVLPIHLLADTILDDFQVNVEPPGHPPQNSPYSATDWETETIYTAWLSQRDGINWDVGLQLFDYDLQTIGEVHYLNVREGFYNCRQPRLVIGASGVGAAWIEERAPNRILFRSLDASGNSISPPVRVEDDFAIVARDSLNMAALDSGYILVWYDERDSSAIWAQIVDLGGNLIGANFPIRPDSTGDILGLEAQNHPDGRVLVSWVTNGQYSRGRWLDAEGNFLGEVFEMADVWSEAPIVNTTVKFATGGYGVLYQYDQGSLLDADICMIYLDSLGTQMGDTVSLGHWRERELMPDLGYTQTFPDLLFLPDSNYVTILHYYSWFQCPGGGPFYFDKNNFIYSSVLAENIVPWGEAYEYQLCQIDMGAFLYTYDPGYTALRTYQISTLDSSESIAWIYEPDFGAGQSKSDILVHQEGDFRVIYTNHLSPGGYIYTRHFDCDGIPSAPDTVVSMTEELYPFPSGEGKIKATGEDLALVIWLYDINHWYSNDIAGTLFEHDLWSGQVYNFGCSHTLFSKGCIPNLDVNISDHVSILWMSFWDGIEFYNEIRCQSFSQLFNYLYSSIGVGSYYWGYAGPSYELDIGLRNDGQFLICWENYGLILIQRGSGYHTLLGDSIQISSDNNGDYCSAPILEKSNEGYWITWIQWDTGTPHRVYLQQIDSDGNPIDSSHAISEPNAQPTGDPDLAVSETDNLAIVWQDARLDAGDIFCRQFNPDGSTFGWEYRVNSDPVGSLQKEPAVAFGPEDRLYYTWTDFRNEGGQGDIYCKVIEWNDALSVEEEPVPIPYEFALYPPSPNPFNATTQIRYSLPHDGQTSLTVHNLLGQTVTKLTEGFMKAGNNQVVFDGSGLASGVYIVRLEVGDQAESRKVVLLK